MPVWHSRPRLCLQARNTGEGAGATRVSQARCVLKPDQHNLRKRRNTHRRTPRPGAVGDVDLELVEDLEAVVEFAPYALAEEGPGKELAAVGVSGELERDAGFLCDVQPDWRVQQQDAGAIAVEIHGAKNGAVAVRVGGVAIVDALPVAGRRARLCRCPAGGRRRGATGPDIRLRCKTLRGCR